MATARRRSGAAPLSAGTLTGAREQRLRSLPSPVGVNFVLALGLFEHLGAGPVWGKLRLRHSLYHPPAQFD
ncbi:transposase domain-containing protein [Streptomyces sp. NBC_00145]|uniref:transposase domain-containing protein n=1 Tax=Streptomyces sp. NBC_00145 TaxID=2975666 RepID=UPI002E196CB3